MNAFLNLYGKRFGRLVVMNQTRKLRNRLQRLCQCDCGSKNWVTAADLVNGHTKSCGCLRAESRKISFGLAARNRALRGYKRNAQRRGLRWNLTDFQFDVLTGQACHFCRRLPTNTMKADDGNGDFIYSGIDRLDSKLGYTIKNVVSCCSICNRAKGNMSLDEFLSWTKDLSEAMS